jgi:hypothetical protein
MGTEPEVKMGGRLPLSFIHEDSSKNKHAREKAHSQNECCSHHSYVYDLHFFPPLYLRFNESNKKPVVNTSHGFAKFLLLRQPGCPCGTRGFPRLAFSGRRAPHQLQRAGVLRLLGVWLYRQTVFYLLSGVSKKQIQCQV